MPKKKKSDSAKAKEKILELMEKEGIDDKLYVKNLKECLNSNNDIVKERALDRVASLKGWDKEDEADANANQLEPLQLSNVSVKDMAKLLGVPENNCKSCKYKRMIEAKPKVIDGKDKKKEHNPKPSSTNKQKKLGN